ncbi:ubiquitin-conjugating enzyme/RWD-like protein [Polychytrium aggregatum]|uniref:ubiquitin-conjugating enzyme/RWD-like protein n=1 Tax=Polychytrium aggregatum TaxID=110093 RepID=UPI0022FE369F|nr:ubiquitin-conjugating enzyme/RWD-like protein [Polychytrium aggregatum]KAI9193220.1 ubiquitin-conjugating enzyme/RWD-like protein [Polychytrium aggregatum]
MDPRRIEREIRQCRLDKSSGVEIFIPEESNMLHLKASFPGPAATPYEGGKFVLNIELPNDYPFKAPKVKFDTRVYHPNVSSQTGAICLDILKDAWSPVLTLKTVVISIQSLLFDPVPDDPQDAEVANHYRSNRESFNAKAREWTRIYADPNTSLDMAGLDPGAITRLVEMGFGRKDVIGALRKVNGNEEQAVDALLNGL